MTRRLPAVNRHEVVRALERGGFYVHHIKGSHCALRHPEKAGLRVVVPLHRKALPAGTVRAIIRQAGLTVDEFVGLL